MEKEIPKILLEDKEKGELCVYYVRAIERQSRGYTLNEEERRCVGGCDNSCNSFNTMQNLHQIDVPYQGA